MTAPAPTCPKCGRAGPWLDPEDEDRQRARSCATSAEIWAAEACPYVPCDLDDCRAKVAPETIEEWRQARDHWRDHGYLGGCSHGR